jgi:hypothetical protein
VTYPVGLSFDGSQGPDDVRPIPVRDPKGAPNLAPKIVVHGEHGLHWDDLDGIGAMIAHNLEREQTVKQAAFNRAVNETLDRARAVSDTRGLEYGDTWALENQFTPFLDSVERLERQASTHPYERYTEIAILEEKALQRLKIVAGIIDIKISRMLGPWKADTVEDMINYLAAFRTWRDEFEIGKF